MSIVERVEASVDFKFTGQKGTCSIKQLEEYIFNARMRGADENSLVTFTTRNDSGSMYGPGHTSGMSVAVQATMGGFPVVPMQEKGMSPRKKAQAIAVGGVVGVFSFLSILVAILLQVF